MLLTNNQFDIILKNFLAERTREGQIIHVA